MNDGLDGVVLDLMYEEKIIIRANESEGWFYVEFYDKDPETNGWDVIREDGYPNLMDAIRGVVKEIDARDAYERKLMDAMEEQTRLEQLQAEYLRFE